MLWYCVYFLKYRILKCIAAIIHYMFSCKHIENNSNSVKVQQPCKTDADVETWLFRVTCRSLSWLCRSSISVLSCRSSIVFCSISFSCSVAPTCRSSSRLRSDSIFIWAGRERGRVELPRPHTARDSVVSRGGAHRSPKQECVLPSKAEGVHVKCKEDLAAVGVEIPRCKAERCYRNVNSEN